jgi:hypothetical protein
MVDGEPDSYVWREVHPEVYAAMPANQVRDFTRTWQDADGTWRYYVRR